MLEFTFSKVLATIKSELLQGYFPGDFPNFWGHLLLYLVTPLDGCFCALHTERRIKNSVKHLRWNLLVKIGNNF